ncbi:uncharacterized protein LOC127803436 [Diospyros lotus]|uniref:uncharacterized protein LOC127803436 n=1 Tax=Diospyros lotus TaxID=55363 RepID=UPI00224F3408|nr:uncharacterized protein LOC127803436 [Diospyros lotus]
MSDRSLCMRHSSRVFNCQPLSEFQGLIISMLHVDPTQLHLNNWAFVRAFEVLCSFLSLEPGLGVFFYHFQWKGAGKGSWLSLNKLRGKGWLKLYDSLYKHFKSDFFKVASTEKEFPFFLETNRHPKCPLFRQREPTILSNIEYANLVLEGQVLVDLLTFSPQLKSTKLVELGDDPKKLAEYMRTTTLGMFKEEVQRRVQVKGAAGPIFKLGQKGTEKTVKGKSARSPKGRPTESTIASQTSTGTIALNIPVFLLEEEYLDAEEIPLASLKRRKLTGGSGPRFQ